MNLEMPRFDQAHVLVLGDIMLDRYWEGGTSRISPEAPVPVVKVEQIKDRPGGAGNVALNIAALGAGVGLSGFTGADEMADSLADMLGGAGVHCAFIRVPGQPTITKLRVISRHQQLIRLDFEEAQWSPTDAALVEGLQAQLDGCGALVLSDYGKGALSQPAPLIAAASSRGIPVLVDPKGTDFARYRGATLLTPNLHEFEAVVGECHDLDILASKGRALCRELALDALLITRGASPPRPTRARSRSA